MTSIGFDSLPDQVTTRITMNGLSFNVLVVGPTGIGKTTLINSLFDFNYGDSPDLEREQQEVELRIKEFRPQNKTIDIRLTIIETKGFNNQLDTNGSYKPIVDYIVAKNEEYLEEEFKVRATRYNAISDGRVHCCIYMISPTRTGLSPLDLTTMKQLHKLVCLVPVVGKSDVLTKQERLTFKERLRQAITLHNIEIYSSENHHLPFAVSGSNEIISQKEKRSRIRSYPWGDMQIERDSEFPQLRDLVLRSNMLALIEYTDRVHYENYRRQVTSGNKVPNDNVEQHYQTKRAALLAEIARLERK